MANIETSRKIKWTIKNVSEVKLKQYNINKRITSSKFRICVDGTFYEWTMSIFSENEDVEFYLNFDKKYAKDLSIHFKVHVGESGCVRSFFVDSSAMLTGIGWGSRNLIHLKDLEDPAKKYVDESQRLIFNIEITLKKEVKLQQAIKPQTAGESYAEFLDDSGSSDSSFTCEDGVKVEVHRLLLIRKSTEFKKIFFAMKQRNMKTKRLNNIDSSTLKEILKYAYTGTAELKDIQIAIKTYQAAVAYDLPELQLQCVDALQNQINIETVLEIFQMASALSLQEVTEKCLQYIMKFSHQLMTTQKWRLLSAGLKDKVCQGFAGISSTEIELETTL